MTNGIRSTKWFRSLTSLKCAFKNFSTPPPNHMSICKQKLRCLVKRKCLYSTSFIVHSVSVSDVALKMVFVQFYFFVFKSVCAGTHCIVFNVKVSESFVLTISSAKYDRVSSLHETPSINFGCMSYVCFLSFTIILLVFLVYRLEEKFYFSIFPLGDSISLVVHLIFNAWNFTF